MRDNFPPVQQYSRNPIMNGWIKFLIRRMDRTRSDRVLHFWELVAILTTPGDM